MDNVFDCEYYAHESKHDTWTKTITAERLAELGTTGPAIKVTTCVWCDYEVIEAA